MNPRQNPLLDKLSLHGLWRLIVTWRTLLAAVSAVLSGLALLWFAYVEGLEINARLSEDFVKVADVQDDLIEQSEALLRDLQNPAVAVDLHVRLSELRTQSVQTIGALAGLRAPTAAIEREQFAYRQALERLVGVTNAIERDGVAGMAAPLDASLQAVSNVGGDFRAEVRDFQGGMWPQLVGAVF